MSLLRRLSVGGTAFAVALLGLVMPPAAFADSRSPLPGVIDLPEWISEGRQPLDSPGTPRDEWVVTGKVSTYISGERAGSTDDSGEETVANIDVFARFQSNNGVWSPIYKTTTTKSTSDSLTGRHSNYAIKMQDFYDYNGDLVQFRPGEGKAQRLQVWINPQQVPQYRLTFSERTGGVIQGYSVRRDYNWVSNSQLMQWGFKDVFSNSTQVSQVNIGLIKVANSLSDLNLGSTTVEPSLAQSSGTKKTLKGYVRWENQTLNRSSSTAYVGRANIDDYPVNTPAVGYVVVGAVQNKDGSVEARCTTTKNLTANDTGVEPNWQINFTNDINVKNMKFQVFQGTCETGNVQLSALPHNMAYWSPFPTTVDDWGSTLNGTAGSPNRGWTGPRWEDNVRVLLRPLQMQLLPHGEKLGQNYGTQSFYGDKVKVEYSRLPLNTPLVAHLYSGSLTDSGSGTPLQSKSFVASAGGNGSIVFDTPLTDTTFKKYWVDVVPEKITKNPQWQVLASQSFLYKPIQLEIDSGIVNENGVFKITQKAPDASTGVKVNDCQIISTVETVDQDALPYDLKHNGCTLTGTPEKSGVHSLWVKFSFTDSNNQSHTATQYLPWTVQPRIKPQLDPSTPDSQRNKYSAVDKYPAEGVPYVGVVSPFADWQGRPFTYQVFTADPAAGSAALVPDADARVTLGDSGLKFNTTTGQITGNTIKGKPAVFWVKATDADNQATVAQKFEIYPGSPLILQRAQLPTGTSDTEYRNANGTPIVIWVSGGEPSASQLSVNGTDLPRNTYATAEILKAYAGTNNTEIQPNSIGGLSCSTQTSTVLGGGQYILCTGTPNVSAVTTYYLQVKYTDKNGRVLDGSKYTLPQIKSLSTLSGAEGWLKLTLLPKVQADTDPGSAVSTKLPEGTKGQNYGPKDIKSYLHGGTGNYSDYTYSASGLPAGLRMSADGVITGTPLETTAPTGVNVTVYLQGKDGTAAERSSTLVTFQLPIKTDLSAAKQTLSAVAQGGTTYVSSQPLLDVQSAGITGGVSPYHFRLQYRDSDTDSWHDAAVSGGRYQVPNADAHHSASGLLLDSNAKLVGVTQGTDAFPQLRVVVSDSDTVSCPDGCKLNIGLDLTRVDTRRPTVDQDASITANVSETVTGFLPINDPSGNPTKYTITSQVNLPGVNLSVEETTGKYTLTATHEAVAGNSGSVTLKVRGANGLEGTVTLLIHVTDQRIPKTNNNVEITLEQGIRVPDTAKVTAAIDSTQSPAIKCYVPSNYQPTGTSGCPSTAQKLPGFDGVSLNPDGTLSGTPVKSDVGEHQVPLKALGVNGKWSTEFSAKITVSPTSLVFEPGIAPGGTKGQPYVWTFNPATGGGNTAKTYMVIGPDNQPVKGCSVTVNSGKPKLTCADGALVNGVTYTLRATAGQGNAAVSIDRVFTPEIYPPVRIESFTLPSAAQQAVYQQADGSPFRFTASGGSGSYGFGFAKDSGHVKASAPLSCTGWILHTMAGDDSGLCLENDGRITGTPQVAGTIDLSKLEVVDSSQHRSGLPANVDTKLVINPLLVITTTCEKPTSGADKYANYPCHGVKNQPVGAGGKLQIVTVSGGGAPYRTLRVEGLDAYNANVTDPAKQVKAGWCDGAPTSNVGGGICLTGTWSKVMVPGSALNIYVTGSAGRTVTVQAFIPVETDLTFTDKPQDANGTPAAIPSGVAIAQTDNGTKPGNIDAETWTKVSGNVDSSLPVLGVTLDKTAVEPGGGQSLPTLVKGGVGPYTYTTEPCSLTDANGNCAIGDTGLYLDKTTGKTIGTPRPGTSAAVIVNVTDADSPAQTKKANLVIEIADTRKPQVTDTKVSAEIGETVQQVIPVSSGSGQYQSVQIGGTKPAWMTVTLANNTLTITGKPDPQHVTSTPQQFTVTVTDANGNTSEPATITYTVKDSRVPDLSALQAGGNLTGREGKDVKGWVDLIPNSDEFGPKITQWQVSGLPQGVTFNPATGKLSPNQIASGQSGTFPITITAQGENGKTATIVRNLVVSRSDLSVEEQETGALTQDRNLVDNPAIIATVSGGSGPYILTGITGLPAGLGATLESNGNIVLNGTIPADASDNPVTITVKDADGVQRTLTRTLHIGTGLSVAKTTPLPATVGSTYSPYCLGVSGGTKPYSINASSALPGGMRWETSPTGDVCLSGTPTDGAGQVATVTFTLRDSATPASEKPVTLKIAVNEKFQATKGTTPTTIYAGSAITPFTAATGSGDSCYAVGTSGCEKAQITYSASGLPAGLTIDSQTGKISGTPTQPTDNKTVKVTVASSAPGSTPITETFQLAVASAFRDPANQFEIKANTTKPELDETGSVKTENAANQVLPEPKIESPGGSVVATGTYAIQGVSPDSQGNYPLGDTGLALSPDGKLVGTLKPGQPPTPGNSGTFDLGNYPVVLKDNAGGQPIGPTNGRFQVTDTRTPDITVNDSAVEVGRDATISIGVTGGSGQIDTVTLSNCNPANNKLSITGTTISVPADAFTKGGKTVCQVTVTDHNGLTQTESITIQVSDNRQPKFNPDEPGVYAWQGLDFTQVTLGSSSTKGIPVARWLADSADSTAAPLRSIAIAGLPDQFKVLSGSTEATKDASGAYICNDPRQCTIVGYAAQGVSGVNDFTLTITADTAKPDGTPTNLKATQSVPLHVFASPLQLTMSTPVGMIRGAAGYSSVVGRVDYRGTIAPDTTAPINALKTASSWDATYALDTTAHYEIVKVKAYSPTDASGSEINNHGLILTATSSGDAALPTPGSVGKQAQTLMLSSTNTGAIPAGTTSLAVELKVTDGHGIVRKATVNIPVVQKLEWAGPPFKSNDAMVALDTVGVPGQTYPAYYAEAKGGDGSLSTSLATVDASINSALEADAKAKFNGGTGYQGIDPVYCAAQGTIKADTRPKCFPIPGLSGAIASGSGTLANPLPLDHQGLFMLSNGKLWGSIPDNVTAGTYSAQVLVIDGSGQLITKKFSVTVEQKLTLTLPGTKLPDGKRGVCYGSTNVKPDSDGKCPAAGDGSGVTVGTYDGPANTTAKCELIPPVAGLTVTCDHGKVAISGAPTQTYDGNATVKVTLSGGAGQSVEQTLPLLIETDMTFKGDSNVKVETNPDGTQKIVVNTTADGNKLPDMKLDITGGVPPYTYHVENSDGSAVSPVTCPAGVPAQTTSGKPIKCYPIGSTGLVLDSEGNVHGTPVPGGSADGKFVVADSDTTSRTKKAAITVNITDQRPPQVYDLTINTTVGATTLSGSTQLVTEDPQNPPVDPNSSNTWTPEQVRAASQKGFHATKPADTLGTVKGCSAGAVPNWLTLGSNGAISLTNGEQVPVDAAGQTLRFCVWYVGPNGVNAPKPAVVSVKVTDQRRVNIGNGNAQTSNSKIGEVLAPDSNPRTLVDLKIPADLFDYGANHGSVTVSKLNPDGTTCMGASCKFSPNGANFTDTSIDGLTVTGLNCATSGDPRSCSIAVSGTPTPSAAGDHQLVYRLTLPNGQTQIISHTLHIPPYDLALSVEQMNPAVEGLSYLDNSKPILAQGGSGNYWFQLWDPHHPVDNAASSDNPAKVGNMELVPTATQVKLKWTPTAEDIAKAKNAKVPVTITVWDKTACQITVEPGQYEPGPANCLYKVTKTMQIPVYATPNTTELKVPPVTQGSGAASTPVYTGSGKAELFTTVPPGNEALFDFEATTGVVKLNNTARPGTYTAVIRITLPGVSNPFFRNVTFTVKEKTVTKPEPNPSSPNPDPQPGNSVSNWYDAITYPVHDLDSLVLRHGGSDRIDTALAVLDFFSGNSLSSDEDRNSVVAYADYADKVNRAWSNTAVLVRDDDYPDALVAGPLAAHYNAPILMTSTQSVPDRVLKALQSHGFTQVILVGNPGAISAGAATQLQNAGFQVQRLGGQDRYRTASAVADHLLVARGQEKSEVYLATGVDYPDALSASSAAIKNTGVVLLTPRNRMDAANEGWINSAKASKVVGVGGPAVTAAEKSVHLDERQVGTDRYETAQKVASAYFPPNPGRIAVATGSDFPDATLAASLTARTGSPLVLTKPQTLTKPTTQFLTRNRASVRKVDVVGGKAAVTEQVRSEIYKALR